MKKFDPYPRKDLCKTKPHLWKMAGSHGPLRKLVAQDRCSRCGEFRQREPTKKERAEHREWLKELRRPMEIHKISHAFTRATEEMSGYPMMTAARRWADKHPERVMVSRVDDDFHAGSLLAFITHEVPKGPKKTWFGVSVHYIPQCTGEKPIRFFLYPGHVDELIDTLQKIRKKSLAYDEVRRERRANADCNRRRNKTKKRGVR